jgi:ABC-2 type transport system permease protein
MLKSAALNPSTATGASRRCRRAADVNLDDGAGQLRRAARYGLILWRRVRAFIARDFSQTLSYRMDFLMRMLQVVIIVTALFFISYVFSGRVSGNYKQWENPFSAWIMGFAMMSYFSCGFSSLANAIRTEQMQGTLENVLMTPIKVPTMIVASSAWEFIQATFFALFYLFLGWGFFGVRFQGNLFLGLTFLILTALVLHCVGILSASFTLVFKRGDPFGAMLATGSFLFSGVLFPTQALDSGVFTGISCVLPTTYGVDGIRRVLIEGQTWGQVRTPFIMLLIFLAGLLPFSLVLFDGALRRAKREGSLVQY